MGANKVDIVFVIDASDSMKTCFEQVKQNLHHFVRSLNQVSFEVRLGLLAYNSKVIGGTIGHSLWSIGGEDRPMDLYQQKINPKDFFTSDLDLFLRALDAVVIEGDECTPLALDTAADFPFVPLDEARRVIILFSNEKIETGMEVYDGDSEGKYLTVFPRVLQKIAKRKIALYAYLPASNAAALMTLLPKSIIHSVDLGAGCWNKIDFGQMFEQMGKSISVSQLQMTREPEYEKALYGQNRWVHLTGEVDPRDRT